MQRIKKESHACLTRCSLTSVNSDGVGDQIFKTTHDFTLISPYKVNSKSAASFYMFVMVLLKKLSMMPFIRVGLYWAIVMDTTPSRKQCKKYAAYSVLRIVECPFAAYPLACSPTAEQREHRSAAGHLLERVICTHYAKNPAWCIIFCVVQQDS